MGIVMDLIHSSSIDGYTDEQASFIRSIAERVERLDVTAPREAAQERPAYWLAVEAGGSVSFGASTDDGNDGEVARDLVNEHINDVLDVSAAERMRLVGVYTHPAPQQPRPSDDELWVQTLRERDDAEGACSRMFTAVRGCVMERPSNDAIAQAFWEQSARGLKTRSWRMSEQDIIERAREIDAAAPTPPEAEPVAEVVANAPYLDATHTPMNELRWFLPGAEDCFPIGTRLYTAQPAPFDDVIRDAERLFEAGWRIAAQWANRDDLLSDIGSGAYVQDRDAAIREQQRGEKDNG